MSLRSHLVERYLRRFTANEDPAWRLALDEVQRISIRWPRRYQWDAAGDWVDLLKYGFRSRVAFVEVDDIPQPYKGTVNFEVDIEGRRRSVAIGYSDYLAIDDVCARNTDLYFKMQFDSRGYAEENVVPGGYVPDGKRLYYHLPRLRRLRDRREYAVDVTARFSTNYAAEVRTAAIEKLTTQSSFSFAGGLNKVSYAEFLREIARSRICIDLPGLGPFCFRLVNYLAVGSCVIAYPHDAMLHVPLEDRKHIVFCKPDMSDLVELCEYYLGNDDAREELAANARAFFDANLHKDNLAAYYLRTIFDRLT